ncbi:hypothetical protein NQK81_09075 [Amycolatopsis roodepoortensis]|uniref:hypothetical protein n=1 Tax=Amycolatopsis roodepoortensis TaxID=700274 RepID=UPI00214B631F|nr:hypothetical protein [Amycolatopsis roodepoortensis]UUV33588.1 hypothetical protein NQK81_09075 [Amycolatopsis roodepoortensis]
MSDSKIGDDVGDVSGDDPPERDPGRGTKPDRRHVLTEVIQLLTALAAAIQEVSRLLGR